MSPASTQESSRAVTHARRLACATFLALAIAIAPTARAAGTAASPWSATDFQGLMKNAVGAMQEWGQTVLRLGELDLEATRQNAGSACEIAQLETFATTQKCLYESLVELEPLAASITDPGRQRYAVLVLSSYYENNARSTVDAAESVFSAAATRSQFEDVRQLAGALLRTTQGYDQLVVAPRLAELYRLQRELHADPETDGHGP